MGEHMETVQAEVMVQDEQTVVHKFFVVSSRKLKKKAMIYCHGAIFAT